MPRRFFRKILPDSHQIRQYRILHIFGEALFHPSLWSLHRRSVASGVAIGLFCGLIPGPLQVLGSAFAALFFKANLAVAIIATFYTNPITIVPLYLLAYQLGSWVLGTNGSHTPTPPPDWSWTDAWGSLQHMGEWMLGLGTPLALGVFLLACLLSSSGYVITRAAWSIYLRRAWLARKKKRG